MNRPHFSKWLLTLKSGVGGSKTACMSVRIEVHGTTLTKTSVMLMAYLEGHPQKIPTLLQKERTGCR